MWISKKKLESKLRETRLDTMREEWKSQQEIDQDERMAKIEKDIKKLKKQVKNGY
jgi:hypothetical protein